MVRPILEMSIRLRFITIVLAGVLLIFGIMQLRTMPVDIYPEFNPPLVEVQTEAVGLSAEEVEALITTPMEADLLNGVAWLDHLQSESVSGLSRILLVFEPGTDPIRARQMVQERLTQAHALPNVSKPPVMLQPLSSTSRVMMVGLSSKTLTPIEMGVLARWSIKPRLMGVPGVANVAVWGQRERQLQVQVNPEQLQAKGVTLRQVIETTGEALWVSPLSFLESSSPGTAGWIDTPNQRLGLRHLLPITTAEDLSKVSVDGANLRLGEVASVVEDHQPLIGDAIVNDGSGLVLVIEKFPGANTLAVTKDVDAALEALRPGLSGVEIDTTLFRPANYIEAMTSNLAMLFLIGGLLVALGLAAFLFQWRTALVGLITIPVALVAASYVLYLRGVPFNTMILAGLAMALGAIIDDAVVDSEGIARRLHEQRQAGSDLPLATILIEAMSGMRSAIGFATLIMLLAVVPVFFLEGLAGAFFQPLATSYVLALLVSLVVSLIVTPAVSLLLLKHAPSTPRKSPLVTWLAHGYQGVLSGMMKAPSFALILVGIVGIASLAALPFLQPALIPELQQSQMMIGWEAAPGTSRTEMNRIAAQVSQAVRAVPGVRNVGSHVGRAETGDQVVGINSGELWVSLDPAANHDATVAGIQAAIDSYPGLVRSLQTYQPARIEEALTSPNQDVVVRVYGYDLAVLRAKAQEVQQAIANVPGIANARVDAQVDQPQVEIKVDLAKAERYGIKPGDVRRAATTLLSGLHVGNLFEDQKVFDVVVIGTTDIRQSLQSVQNLLIDVPSGGHVRLGEVATLQIVPAPVMIERDIVSRYIDVGATISDRNVGAVTAAVKASLTGVTFPLEFHAEVIGIAADHQAAQQRVLMVVVIALIGMFLLFQAAFRSWRFAAIAFGALPTALAGGILASFLSGGLLTIGTIFGLIAVLGIAVRQTVALTSHLQQLTDQGGPFGPELVARGAQDRLAPILMTTLTTALAFLPIVVVGPIPGTEIVRPMAIVLLGGLATSVVLELLLMPALYLQFGSTPEPAPPIAKLGDLMERAVGS